MGVREVRTLEDNDFESLYRRHAERLWRALLSYTGNPEIASDAAAEAFAQCLARGADVHSPASWVWRAAFRIAAGQLQEANRLSTLSELSGPAFDDVHADTDLLTALRALPARQRASLVLYYYAGFNTREISRILDSSAATVRVHLNRGRRRLRRILEDDDG